MKPSEKIPKMKPEFFKNLPSEIVIDILSRPPIRAIAICKCVCKPWRDLLRTREFVDYHLSKSVPGFIIGQDWEPENYKIFEFIDVIGLESHNLHYNRVIKFDASIGSNNYSQLKGSSNGLLLFIRKVVDWDTLHICNPTTRECIQLPYDGAVYSDSSMGTSAFGVSKLTGQHKVVRIFHEQNYPRDIDTNILLNVVRSVCLVYVLGTGLWRSINPPAPFIYDSRSIGASLNGYIHWLVETADSSHCISCFDIETENFSTFSPPPIPVSEVVLVGLVVLGGCLCVSYNTAEEIIIWLMKEYGDEKSWAREFVIRKDPEYFCNSDDFCCQFVSPFKVFQDGDVLMAWYDLHLFYYSSKTKTTKVLELDVFGLTEDDEGEGISAMLHTSSFLSLRSFPKESVSTF